MSKASVNNRSHVGKSNRTMTTKENKERDAGMSNITFFTFLKIIKNKI